MRHAVQAILAKDAQNNPLYNMTDFKTLLTIVDPFAQ